MLAPSSSRNSTEASDDESNRYEKSPLTTPRTIWPLHEPDKLDHAATVDKSNLDSAVPTDRGVRCSDLHC